ncbi:hypothetical protein [Thioclava sp. F36-6]|uniref:hypothetical protein n=1 Tax=Thioclava sp. F36-6 TaxID=1915316 RepID=UPI0009980487|nr:hypothetical protein [Thioclava sp. F36-6]OOY33019.1 hypothetical protein BMI88_03905 [Thioclava sp. F36-6]
MVPGADDPRWKRVLTSQSDLSAASLATKILIARLRREVAASPASLGDKIAELREFVAKNAFAAGDVAAF